MGHYRLLSCRGAHTNQSLRDHDGLPFFRNKEKIFECTTEEKGRFGGFEGRWVRIRCLFFCATVQYFRNEKSHVFAGKVQLIFLAKSCIMLEIIELNGVRPKHTLAAWTCVTSAARFWLETGCFMRLPSFFAKASIMCDISWNLGHFIREWAGGGEKYLGTRIRDSESKHARLTSVCFGWIPISPWYRA